MNTEIKVEEVDIYKELKTEFGGLGANSFQGKMQDYVKSGTPIVACTDDFFPELFEAMDLPFYFVVRQGLESAFHAGRGPEAVDGYDEFNGASTLCSLQKASAYLLVKDLLPKPAAIVMTSTSCDAQTAVNELMSNYGPWAEVPRISVDASFEKDEASMEYLGKQWIQTIPFLEKATGKKFDLGKFKEVCEESNKQTQLLFDFQELRRAVPSPIRAEWGFIAYMGCRWSACGRQEGTEWMQRLYDATAQRVKEKKGIDGVTEKIRYTWFDILPCWSDKLFPRLEQEFGAVNLMDLYGYCAPWPSIDTSSLESIFTSMAKRFLIGNPMTRQIFALSTVYGGDAVNIAKNFKCDAVIMPGHVGHKDGAASHKIVKDMFRELGIPFFVIGCDVFDERYMDPEVVYQKISAFFETSGLT
ncbi:MAG: 2-hydroxyacyl-CoA dehydratase family protein [Ignavibacteriota bacterium]